MKEKLINILQIIGMCILMSAMIGFIGYQFLILSFSQPREESPAFIEQREKEQDEAREEERMQYKVQERECHDLRQKHFNDEIPWENAECNEFE